MILLLSKELHSKTLDLDNLVFGGTSMADFNKGCNCGDRNYTCDKALTIDLNRVLKDKLYQKSSLDLSPARKLSLPDSVIKVQAIKSFLIFEECNFYITAASIEKVYKACKWSDPNKKDNYCLKKKCIESIIFSCQLDLQFLSQNKIDKIGDNAKVGSCNIKNKPIKADSPMNLKNNTCVKQFLETSTSAAEKGNFSLKIVFTDIFVHYVTGDLAKIIEYFVRFSTTYGKILYVFSEGSEEFKNFCKCFGKESNMIDILNVFVALIVGCINESEAQSGNLKDLTC